MRHQTTLTDLARLGFADLETSRQRLADFDDLSIAVTPLFAHAADPDQALIALSRLREQSPEQLAPVVADDAATARLVRVLGASAGLGDFLLRRPAELDALLQPLPKPLDAATYSADILAATEGLDLDAAVTALRVRYRRHLVQLTVWDLEQKDPLAAVSVVAAALADLAAAALDASLAVARRSTRFPDADVAKTRLAIIGMGKAGARELNYVSDVDVIFVAEAADDLASDRAVEIATRLAMETMRGIHEPAFEPELW